MIKLNQLPIDSLCSGMFSDNLDKMRASGRVVAGWRSNFTPFRTMGRARTVMLETVETDDENIRTGLSFIETIEPDEILLVQGSESFAYFGELMTRLAVRRKMAGVVIEGLTRDSVYTLKEKALPILFRGLSPVDIKGRGRVKTVDVPVRIGHLEINPGEFIFADSDALVAVPQRLENDLAQRLLNNIAEELDAIRLIEDGASIEQILDHVKEF